MNLRLLIDGIVRQTTVLIAQLSTASGARSPLARISDEVFVSLAREIEAQGVRKQVVADMFGLAMRSYQKKMARLAESASARDKTLWEAVFEFVTEHNPTRARVLERFSYDGERDVSAVLNDLVRSGLVYTTGSGSAAVFGATPGDVQRTVQHVQDLESVENWVWLLVFRREATTSSELLNITRCESTTLDLALEHLLNDGRLQRDGDKFSASNVVLPVGTEQGWEPAILDHFRTVAVAIAQKVRLGGTPSPLREQIGGSTFTFTVTDDHPFDRQVRELLQRYRTEVQQLWDEVARHNQEQPPDPKRAMRVSFYLGQLVEAGPEQEETANEDNV
jgi:hypothetical protein